MVRTCNQRVTHQKPIVRSILCSNFCPASVRAATPTHPHLSLYLFRCLWDLENFMLCLAQRDKTCAKLINNMTNVWWSLSAKIILTLIFASFNSFLSVSLSMLLLHFQIYRGNGYPQ